jgi:hypothetical protein
MKHPRRKGNKNRANLIKLLEKKGLNVAIVERTGRFVSPKDAYSLFDLLAIDDECNVYLIQCSTNVSHPHYLLAAFKKRYKKFIIKQYVSYDREDKFKVFNYKRDGTWETESE